MRIHKESASKGAMIWGVRKRIGEEGRGRERGVE
jgi:hypothetical protein